MKTRILTALVFASVMIGVPFLGSIPTFFLYLLIAGGCAYELAKLNAIQAKMPAILAATLPSFFSFSYFSRPSMIPNISIFGFAIFSLVFILLSLELFKKNNQSQASSGVTSMAFLYLGIPFSLVSVLLYAEDFYSPLYLLGTLSLIWSNDSFAYLVGSKFGKKKIFSHISPQKTLEGYLGGLVLTVILAYFISFYFFEKQIFLWTGLGFIAAIMGSAGDLFESLLKRNAGVKDTGRFMPGHGGWLDRFDAMIFVLPFAAFWIILNLK
jgi:phosphatidate cytidylyltransferase